MKLVSLKTSALFSGLAHVGLAGGVIVSSWWGQGAHFPQVTNATPSITVEIIKTQSSVAQLNQQLPKPSVTRRLRSPHAIKQPVAVASSQTSSPTKDTPVAMPASVQQEVIPAHYELGSAFCPTPLYPTLARKKKLTGRVLAQLNVDAEGKVQDVMIVHSSGHKILDESVYETLKIWHLHPAMIDGKPIATQLEVPIRFELSSI